jgi:hypothetical protein
VGKTSAVKELAEFLELNIRLILPLSQEEIVKEFGTGPTNPSSKDLYVIEADGMGAKKYSILKNYIKYAQRPIVFIAQSKDKLNKRVVKKLEIVDFSYPSVEDVEKFLRFTFDWDGNIEDIYDPDMRVVISRFYTGEKLSKPGKEKTISAKELAIELGFGYVKKGLFEELEQPLWWVIRWLTYNQHFKFPRSPTILLKNLSRLSFIDEYKFSGVEDYLHYMLMGIRGSPRRAFFKFPIWPKKEKEVENYVELNKAPERPKQESFSLDKWL